MWLIKAADRVFNSCSFLRLPTALLRSRFAGKARSIHDKAVVPWRILLGIYSFHLHTHARTITFFRFNGTAYYAYHFFDFFFAVRIKNSTILWSSISFPGRLVFLFEVLTGCSLSSTTALTRTSAQVDLQSQVGWKYQSHGWRFSWSHCIIVTIPLFLRHSRPSPLNGRKPLFSLSCLPQISWYEVGPPLPLLSDFYQQSY